jgi:hypothetical protein
MSTPVVCLFAGSRIEVRASILTGLVFSWPFSSLSAFFTLYHHTIFRAINYVIWSTVLKSREENNIFLDKHPPRQENGRKRRVSCTSGPIVSPA